jgi:hypothetical protein
MPAWLKSVRWRTVLVRALLMPVLPCIQWGPFTHPDIARRAYQKCSGAAADAPIPEIREAIDANLRVFMFAANSPDAISTNHFLRNRISYDYAHNYMPDSPEGLPLFGLKLVKEALRRVRELSDRDSDRGRDADGHRRRPRFGGRDSIGSGSSNTCGVVTTAPAGPRRALALRDLAFACGWLAHQVSDWVPHYLDVARQVPGAGVRTFTGYANSHQVLTPAFHEDILASKVWIEHGIVEMFHDLHSVAHDTSGMLDLGKTGVWLPLEPADNIITAVSRSFLSRGQSKIPARHLPALAEDFSAIIRGLDSIMVLLRRLQPGLDCAIDQFVAERQQYVDMSIQQTYDWIFALTEERLEELSEAHPEDAATQRAEIVPLRYDSALQKLAFRVGSSVSPSLVEAMAKPGAMIAVPLKIGPVSTELRVDLIERFKRPLLEAAGRIGTTDTETRAAATFTVALLGAEPGRDIIKAATDAYCSGLKPIAALDYDPARYAGRNEDEVLLDMVNRREIDIRFTPALRTDKNTPQYMLDPDTVILQVNGCCSNDPDAPFTAVPVETESQILRYKLILRDDICFSTLHLFADVCDGRGNQCHSDYLDRQVRMC